MDGGVERIGSGAASGRWRVAGHAAREEPLVVSDHAAALHWLLDRLDAAGGRWPPDAVGVRVVHGGPGHSCPCRVAPGTIAEFAAIEAWDRDHLPQQVAILSLLAGRWPDVPVVACFDTAFHHAMPAVSQRLTIPRRLQGDGIRRYGFHGLSYTYLLEALATRFGAPTARGRVILAHVGAGVSLAAVHDGQPLDTTMGFTPTAGVMMATRPGDLDPGLLLHLIRTGPLTPDAVDDLINRESGLLGVSGISGDMRRLLELEATRPEAADAIELFCHQLRKAIGAMAAVVGGVDTLVFSGGIGANSATIRARCTDRLAHLGVMLDEARNAAGGPLISPDTAGCATYALPTDEEVVIARETAATLGWAGPASPAGD